MSRAVTDTKVLMSFEEYARHRARTYLEAMGVTMWGRAYDLSQPESKEQAVEFLADAFRGVLDGGLRS